MSIKKGANRLFVLIWAVWLMIGFAAYYRELGTAFGSSYWTVPEVVSRQLSACNGSRSIENGCLFANDPKLGDVVTNDQSRTGVRVFVWGFLVAPIGLYLILWMLFVGMRWVLNGFRGK